ncbi:precorrin-3B C(17)-methyltransferase [Streptomyces sp. NPDC059787]|uniref:precorrin-3B C(17)-methyltransferase n=1 Tax=Streptomyces sp. NPDC059787 TaxID=3346947 RepID=UPI003652B49D
MPRTRPRLLAALPFVLLVAVTAGCADREVSSSEPRGYCPLPEEQGPTPSPCITFDWNRRLAENHGYRERISITAEQKETAAPRAKALATALGKQAGTGATEDGLRTAVADAIGVPPEGVEIRMQGFGVPDHGVLVGGGSANRVCLVGTVDAADRVEVEVVGRTVEGTCLPGEGGH